MTDQEPTVTPQAPVIAKAGGPFVCKAEPPKKYFGILVEPGAEVPRCPNCKKACTPAKGS